MQDTDIHLEEQQFRALEHLAAEDRQSVTDLVRTAIDDYLTRRLASEPLWPERLDALVTRVQSRVPADTPSQEIEADVSAARDEVRQMRRAARRR